MYSRSLLGILLLLPGCAQQPYAASSSARTQVAPEQALECVKRELPKLGYKQNSLDVAEHRINATKYDTEARRADVQFRRLVNRLEVEIGPEAGGQTSIDVRGRTFAEYTTQRGPTEVEEKASPEVNDAAQKLLSACRG
jgi:PBP1b-binding outer membrane lipoprotein LpoB